MRRTPILLLTTGLSFAGALMVLAQKPRPTAMPVARKPVVPAQKLPSDIKTAKDAGARENWKPEGPNDPFIYLYGDSATYRETPEGAISTLQGNAHLLYKETRFESDRIVYNQKTQIGKAPGKLRIDDAQNTIVGDQGEADYGRKVAKLTGNITIDARPKPGAGNAPEGSARREFKEPATITCSEVIYNWKTKVADTSKDTVIRCKVKEHTWVVTADKIQWRGKEETARLSGNILAKNEEGSELKLETATFVLTEGKEFFSGDSLRDSKVKINDKEDDGDKGDAKPGDPKTTPPPDKKGNP